MAWDPTFDWADASSFRGEGRKKSILSEMSTQINALRNFVIYSGSPYAITPPANGDAYSWVASFDNLMTTLIPKFLDTVSHDWSFWSEAKLETAIGISRPTSRVQGGLITPEWINWNYQAIELLERKAFFTEYWDGTEYSSGVWKDTNFNTRWINPVWSLEGSIDTVNQEASFPGGGLTSLQTMEFNTLRAMGSQPGYPDSEWRGSQEFTVTMDPGYDNVLSAHGFSSFRYFASGTYFKVEPWNTSYGAWTYVNSDWTEGTYDKLTSLDTKFLSGSWKAVQLKIGSTYRTEFYFNSILQGQFDGTAQIHWGPSMFTLQSEGPLTIGPIEFFYEDGGVR